MVQLVRVSFTRMPLTRQHPVLADERPLGDDRDHDRLANDAGDSINQVS